ncbi:hypothetical protein L593_04095 [Salinarchaeum sp. Harcht-Bsk1]|uniref:GAP family protein n=1 Tax=Salinarchaeum sp. Harcht-Bsk1 TaxID=1333523 RepID=UPI00034230EB|nr:GAP family protein [Salinarchaeum sp. Harcht-Bsk1]AGN00770.1 hypothetical protein L593_04095 [Salinarchaeum sp. Harcht-Bsk1]
MSLLQVLPLAIVMVAGPQFLSAIFLATTDRWRANSLAFVAGAALSISAVVTAAYLLGGGVRDQTGSSGVLDAVILGLLLLAMVRVYLNREESEPPEWMGKLTTASPRFSFRLGVLLLGFFPTDVITSVSVGSFLAAQEAPLTDALGFLAVTLTLLALPSLTVLAFSERAEAFLPRVREWMNDNAWIVNEVVLLFFVAIVGSNFL